MKKFFKYSFFGAVWLGTVGIATAIGLYNYFDQGLPKNIAELKTETWKQPLRIYDSKGVLLQEYGSERRIPLQFQEFPQILKDAIISVEDRKFYEHRGVDPKAIARSAYVLITTGEKSQGGSTITQQLARNYYLNSKKEFVRKIKEIILAFRMESVLTKDEILNLYMNKIFLGNRSYGFEAAAHTYFNKSVKIDPKTHKSELTIQEAALLAGLQQSPSRWNPIRSPENATRRRNIVLGAMLENGVITQAQYDEAVHTAWNATAKPKETLNTPKSYSGYLTELARQSIYAVRQDKAYTDGYSVYLTVDIETQKAAVQAVRKNLIEYDLRHGWRGVKETMFNGSWNKLSAEEKEKVKDRLWNKEEVMPLEPAVVIGVDNKGATLLIRKSENKVKKEFEVFMPAENMRWAFNSKVKTPAQLLKEGDLIWYTKGKNSKTKAETYLLRQIPEANSGLASIDSRDGKVISMVGGFSYENSSFNRATQARVQIGSTMKPFVYAAALSNGFTLGSIIDDAPLTVKLGKNKVWKPKNYAGNFKGNVTIRQAIAQSINIPAVKVARDVGIDNFADNWLVRFGFARNDYEAVNSLVLGAANFTPLEMARAYAVFDNGGFLVKPYFIDRVLDVRGNTVLKTTPERVPTGPDDLTCKYDAPVIYDTENFKDLEKVNVVKIKLEDNEEAQNKTARINEIADSKSSEFEDDDARDIQNKDQLGEVLSIVEGNTEQKLCAPRVLDPSIAWLMHNALTSTINGGPGYGGTSTALKVLNRKDMGGKTGTTNNSRAAWFAGYYSYTSTAVFTAIDTNKSLGARETGGKAGLPAWLYYYQNLRAIGVDYPVYYPPTPDNLVSTKINRWTGLLDSTGYLEYFIDGTQPTQLTPKIQEKPIDINGDKADGGLF